MVYIASTDEGASVEYFFAVWKFLSDHGVDCVVVESLAHCDQRFGFVGASPGAVHVYTGHFLRLAHEAGMASLGTQGAPT